MHKSLLIALLLLLLNAVVTSAIYHPQETERIIRSNLREYYENILDEVLSSRGSDVLLSMGRMRPDRRGGVFETLQKEAGAFGVHDVHASCLVQLPEMITVQITQLHGHLLESVEPNLVELWPTLMPSRDTYRKAEDFEFNEEIPSMSLPGQDELISTVYSLNQAMGYRLSQQIDRFDVFLKVSADINSCNSKLPNVSKTTSWFSDIISWLSPTQTDPSGISLEKRENAESSTTKRFLNSHLDIVRQEMWTEFDDRVNDLITSISEDIMDDE
ncbi:hypothetical protein BC943DRAFT_335263 [Umbelopsis sp. AD052]|nr:hypothetical protein BC943DRAFT_335263 [Umbelopsis sp. AD052]